MRPEPAAQDRFVGRRGVGRRSVTALTAHAEFDVELVADRLVNEAILLGSVGEGLPVFFVHDGEGEILPYYGLAKELASTHPEVNLS